MVAEVDCGSHLAPSCSQCVSQGTAVRTECAGECAFLGPRCAPILAPQHAVHSLEALRSPFSTEREDLLLFPTWETSAASAVGALLGIDPSHQPASHATKTGADGVAYAAPVVLFAEMHRGSLPPRRERVVGVLREPFEFAVHALARPDVVETLFPEEQTGHTGTDRRGALDGNEVAGTTRLSCPELLHSDVSARALIEASFAEIIGGNRSRWHSGTNRVNFVSPAAPAGVGELAALAHACPNPLSRVLALYLVHSRRSLDSDAVLRCARSRKCSATTLGAVAKQALLSLDALAIAHHPLLSIHLLSRKMRTVPLLYRPRLAREVGTPYAGNGGDGGEGRMGLTAVGPGSWSTAPRARSWAAMADLGEARGAGTVNSREDAERAQVGMGGSMTALAALRAEWLRLNHVDAEVWALARGIFSLRLRRAGLPAAPRCELTAVPPITLRDFMNSARIFDNDHGRGRPPSVLGPPPVAWSWDRHTLVFHHMAKCGGTSFNGRLMSLTDRRGVSPQEEAQLLGLSGKVSAHVGQARGAPATAADGGKRIIIGRCVCAVVPNEYHNGHAIVKDRNCACPRKPAHAARIRLPSPKPVNGREIRFHFLEEQWLVSPETTGWHGGVHAPIAYVQAAVMLSAKTAGRRHLAESIHYVTMLREPLDRFLSEFYETYDGWEAVFGTPPHLRRPCSAFLSSENSKLAQRGIDETTKARYDRLFPYWISCPRNMAADRQTRALTHDGWALVANAGNEPIGYGGIGHGERKLERIVCSRLPIAGPTANASARASRRRECLWLLARHALLQFDFFGINEERCKSEKLFEAQFGLRFSTTPGAVSAGKGKHKVAKLRMESLTEAQRQRIARLNRNDILLYREALRIFRRRLRFYGIPDNITCGSPPAKHSFRFWNG